MMGSVHAAAIVAIGRVGYCRCRQTRRRDHLPVHWCRYSHRCRRDQDGGTTLEVGLFSFLAMVVGAMFCTNLVDNTCPKGATNFLAKHNLEHQNLTQLTFQNISSTVLFSQVSVC